MHKSNVAIQRASKQQRLQWDEQWCRWDDGRPFVLVTSSSFSDGDRWWLNNGPRDVALPHHQPGVSAVDNAGDSATVCRLQSLRSIDVNYPGSGAQRHVRPGRTGPVRTSTRFTLLVVVRPIHQCGHTERGRPGSHSRLKQANPRDRVTRVMLLALK